jgi:hypothetical protein
MVVIFQMPTLAEIKTGHPSPMKRRNSRGMWAESNAQKEWYLKNEVFLDEDIKKMLNGSLNVVQFLLTTTGCFYFFHYKHISMYLPINTSSIIHA